MSNFQVKLEKLNNKVITPRKLKLPKSQGNEVFPIANPNIVLFAPKNTGKSTVIDNILPLFLKKNTKVIFFAGQLRNDPTYKAIQSDLRKRGIKFYNGTTLKVEGEKDNELKRLIRYMCDKKELNSTNDEDSQDEDSQDEDSYESDEDSDNDSIKKKLGNIVLILDDLFSELRDVYVTKLSKENRHMKCTTIMSTQSLNDVHPDALKQMQYILVFAKMSDDKLKELHKKIGLVDSYDKFKKLYDTAIDEKSGTKSHNFLTIDKETNSYRKNLNEKIYI